MDDASIWLRELITPTDVYLHGATDLVHWERTPYQELCVADSPSFGRMLFLDGIVQSSAADEFMYHEALVQPAMMAVGTPRRVLVLGGGEGATLREVLRWRCVDTAVMVDLDDRVVAVAREHLGAWHRGSFDDARTTLLHADAVAYLRDCAPGSFDVVVSDMTDPVEEGPAMFCFTAEYFAAVARVLAPGGVLALQAGPVNPVEIALHAKVCRTVATAFAHVVPYPCLAPVYGRPLGFVVASGEPLTDRLDPARTAPLVADHLTGPSRMIDPAAAHALAAVPPYVRAAIDAASSVFTDAAPPRTAHAAGWESA